MARYIREIPIRQNPSESFGAIHNYLIEDGFEYIEYDGENVFKKGNGWITGPTFIKVSYSSTHVRLEAWIKYAILPGVFVGECGMTGFVGAMAKGTMKRCTAWIEQTLGAMPMPEPAYIPAQPQVNPYAAQQPQVNPYAAQNPYAQQTAPYAQSQVYNPNLPKPLPFGQYVSLGEYRNIYASDSFHKTIRGWCIAGYAMCGFGLLVGFLLSGPFALIDSAIQIGLLLGVHLKKSKGCAIGLIVYAAISMLIGLLASGSPTGWGWLALGIATCSAINQVDKQYREEMARRNPMGY